MIFNSVLNCFKKQINFISCFIECPISFSGESDESLFVNNTDYSLKYSKYYKKIYLIFAYALFLSVNGLFGGYHKNIDFETRLSVMLFSVMWPICCVTFFPLFAHSKKFTNCLNKFLVYERNRWKNGE